MATDKYLDPTQSQHQPGLEPSASHPYQGIEVQSYPVLTYMQQQQQQQQWTERHSAPPTPDEKDSVASATADPRRRIVGLTVPVFWGLLIALVLAVAGAIAGGLAAQGRNSSNSSNTGPSGSGSPPPGEATTTAKPAVAQPPAGESATVTMLLPIVQASAVPLDGGCPKINATRYVPREATANGTTGPGAGITLPGQSSPQAFVQLCSTNFPEGDEKPGVRDLVSFFAPTLEQCMLSCAQYNRQYQRETGAKGQGGAGDGGNGFCMGVSIVKIRKFPTDDD